MTGTTELRAAITGLMGLAATEEEMLLASAPDGKDGSPDRWAAAPLVAHNAEFGQQQVARLEARYLGVPDPALGIAAYSMACAQAAADPDLSRLQGART
jgi:hypothetical protein